MEKGKPRTTQSPGLNSTMARRQPSSDLSICMSFILETSSVRTLRTGNKTGEEKAMSPRPPRADKMNATARIVGTHPIFQTICQVLGAQR